ncbi:MAG: hypothetical protein Q8P62_01765 [Candidatus Peregrinibacteria bacterium]|nr:hypothetical protein [Candidatus Peregrinibacteria bacterium]
MHLTCLNNSQKNFHKEHRFVFLFTEIVIGLSKAGEGIGKMFESGAKLIDVATTVANKAVGALSKGFDVGDALLQKAADKVMAGDLKNLPEYDELDPLFSKKASDGNEIEFSATNDTLNTLVDYDISLACLNLRMDELKDLYLPLINECDYVESMEKRAKSLDMEKEKTEVRARIARRKRAMKKLPVGTDEYNDIKTGLGEDIADLDALEKLSSDSPERPTPMVQQREWPPASGTYIGRFTFDKSRPVKLNLKKYKAFLIKNVTWYVRRVNEFNTEIDKINYYKAKLLLAAKSSFSATDKALYAKNQETIALLLNDAQSDAARKPQEKTARDFKWFNN